LGSKHIGVTLTFQGSVMI